MNVVRARESDLDRAWDILDEYNDAVGVVKRDERATFGEFLRSPNGFWLALDGERVTGCVALRPLPNVEAACEVKRLYVRPFYRGRGIATALMGAVEAYALNARYRAIYLDTFDALAAAVSFYEARGYVRIDRYNDNPQATIFMRRSLANSAN